MLASFLVPMFCDDEGLRPEVRGGVLVVVLAVWCSPWRGWLFGGDFGDGAGGGISSTIVLFAA